MIHLPLPEGAANSQNDRAKLDVVIDTARSSATRKALTDTVMDTVERRIEAYLQGMGEPTRIGPSPFADSTEQVTRDELFGLYDKSSLAAEAIKQTARDSSSGNLCPYCAMRLSVKKENGNHPLDHFLPRSQYSEYSLFSANLVLSCTDCNGVKLEQVTATGGAHRGFLHPYFDEAGTVSFVVATVHDVDGVPGYSFHVDDNGLTDEQKSVVRSHLGLLDLAGRWARYVASDILNSSFRQWAAMLRRGIDLEGIRDEIRSEAGHFSRICPNLPEGVALAALAESDELVTWLNAAANDLNPMTQQ